MPGIEIYFPDPKLFWINELTNTRVTVIQQEQMQTLSLERNVEFGVKSRDSIHELA